jgi:FMN phosphatase YigB (HAD superfamily)
MRAVIFDVGRVLVHWDLDATIDGLAGISQVEHEQLRQLTRRVYHDFGTGSLSASEFHRYLIEQAGASDNWGLFYAAVCRGLCRDETALAFAAQLASLGTPLGIISNTNHIHVQWLNDNLPELSLFRSVVWSSDVGLLKPDRAIYELAVGQMAVPPAETMFVDDLEENVAGARSAGLAGILHRNWAETRQAIEAWL